MTISKFENPDDSNYARWTYAGKVVEKRYSGTTYAVVLASGSGVAIVEPHAGDPNNAVIVNADGTERVRLTNPLTSRKAIAFVYPFYEGEDLAFVVALPTVDFACVFDEQGHCLRTHETR